MNKHLLECQPEMLKVIDEGLNFVPYGRAAPVVQEINQQLMAWMKGNTNKQQEDSAAGSPVKQEANNLVI